MSGVEVERKWLVPEPPAFVLAAGAKRIDQGYLTVGADGAETRVRRKGTEHTLTVKSGKGLVRDEAEIELTPEQFAALWPATAGAQVQKVRHTLTADDGHVIELDVYEGTLEGLVVAEVEFDDPRVADRFVAPHWFGREVTADDAFKNRRLAADGLPRV
jgi:adenylate cyclase